MAKNKGIAQANRTRRHEEAQQRKVEYDKLTPQQKLKRLDDAGLRAARQRKRLQAQIDAGQ